MADRVREAPDVPPGDLRVPGAIQVPCCADPDIAAGPAREPVADRCSGQADRPLLPLTAFYVGFGRATSSAVGSSARPPRAWATVVATSEGRAERAVQRHVHDLVSSQYQRTSPHADPPSAIMLSAGMWMPHSQHETTAVPPGPGLESAAAGGPGSAGRWLRRPARRSAALLTARSDLSRRLQPWLLLVPCQHAAADLVTEMPWPCPVASSP